MDATKNVFNYGLDTAKSIEPKAQETTTSGLSAMDQVKSFFKNIMSGSRPAQFAAAAPEINAINERSDAARTQQSNLGTARGGGVASTAADAETSRMKSTDDMLFGARTGAASEVGKLGAQESQVGLEQLSAALRALGMSDEAIAHFTQAAIQKKAQNTQGWMNLFKLGTSVAGGLAGGLGGGGEVAPPTAADESLYSPNMTSLGF